MRKILVILAVLVFAGSLSAQTGRGSIYGQVFDDEGTPLPGVTVTLSGSLTAPVDYVTGAQGRFRFSNVAPGRDYVVTAKLDGFKTKRFENVEIEFGKNVNLKIELEVGGLQEEVTVMAEVPIIDIKRTEVGMVHTEELMQNLPTTRDVWMLEKMTPGVYSRYWNVGGTESLQQDAGSARGDPDHYMTMYAIDGINITSMAARGSAAIYYNYDTIEETNIVVGGAADVTQQTSGLSNNVIMKRGGNNMTMGGRVFISDEAFQGDNFSDKLKEAGVEHMAQINETRDLGFYIGGPVIRDKAWFFLAYDYQFISFDDVFGTRNDFEGWSFDFKTNLQLIPSNRFEFYIRGNPRISEGEDASPELPDGLLMGPTARFGNPLIKIQDEHTFGEKFFVSAKFAGMGGWSQWTPMIDTERTKLAYWNVADRIWEGSALQELQSRPHNRFQVVGDYFNDSLFGVSHQIRFGGEYAVHSTISEDAFTGNVMVRYNYNEPTVDYDGDGSPDIYPGMQRVEVERGSYSSRTTKAMSLFLQDTVTIDRLNVNFGLRYDRQLPFVDPQEVLAVIKDNPVWMNHFSASATNAIDSMIPAVSMPEIQGYDSEGNDYSWTNISPRFSVTWDVTGDGKNVLKTHAATYYQWMGSSHAYRWAPGGTGGWMHFWSTDANGNGLYELDELYWHNTGDYSLYRAFDDAGNFLGDLNDGAGVFYGSFDPLNPSQTTDPYRIIDKETTAPRTVEIGVTFEKELFKDLSVTLAPSFRRYDQWNWFLKYFPATGELESRDWYMSAGTPPSNIPGIGDTKQASEHEWYVLKPEYGYTPWSYEKKRPDYYIDYFGMDFIFNKRLSNRWMLNGSLTLASQQAHFGDEGMNDPTQTWALEGRGSTGRGEGETVRSGRYDTPVWMFKMSGLYQLPIWDIDLSFTFNGRKGRKIRESFEIVDYSLPNPRSQSNMIWMLPYGTETSEDVFLMNFRIQKRLNFRDIGRVTFSFDLYNVFNASTIHWRYPKDHGRYTVQGDVFSPNPSFYYAQDNFAPRSFKLGITYRF